MHRLTKHPTDDPCTSQKQEVLFPDFLTLFLKFIIKSLIHSELVKFFSGVGCPSLAYFKNINSIGRECPNFEGGMGGRIGTQWENVIFSLTHPQFP